MPLFGPHPLRSRLAAIAIPTFATIAVAWLVLARAEPTAAPPPDDRPADAAVHERYAAARLRLAELQVTRAEALNAQTPGQVAETDMRRLHNRAMLLRQQMHATSRLPHGNALEMQQAAARIAVEITAEDLRAARAVRARNPAACSENALQQIEAKAEIAQMRLEIWKDPSFRRSPVDIMQMQIDQLTDFVLEAVGSIDSAPTMQRR